MSRSGSGDEELEQAQSRVGRTIRGKWTLDSLIGIGGMAAVYAATHKLGRRDAIKILHPQIAVSKELRARFEQEARAVIKLGHPGTVQVLDVDVTEEGAPFMVMEYLDGESLGQRAFRLGGLDEQELFGYTERLLEVLAAAHAQGIIHRDIKPDNLFITTDGRLKVLDFGIARMREGGPGNVHTRTGAMLGTTSYMAPEQIHAKPIDGRADLYAVGATLFRILAKKKIHEADSDAELLMKMGSTPAPPLRVAAPHVSLRAARVVDRALSFERDRRYPDAASMQADVRAVLNGQDPPFATQMALTTETATRAEVSSPASGGPIAGSIAIAAAGAGPVSATDPTNFGSVAPTAPGDNGPPAAPMSSFVPPSYGAPTSAPMPSAPSPGSGYPQSGSYGAASHAGYAMVPPSSGNTSSGNTSSGNTGSGNTGSGNPAQDMTSAAWGGQPEQTTAKKTPVATLVGVAALMLAIGGGITMLILSGGDEKRSSSSKSASDDDDDDDSPVKPKSSASAAATSAAGDPKPTATTPGVSTPTSTNTLKTPSQTATVPTPPTPTGRPTVTPTATPSAQIPSSRPTTSPSSGPGNGTKAPKDKEKKPRDRGE